MPSSRMYYKSRYPRVLGHRGAAGTFPENTLPSFRAARHLRADVLEMDVHLTADSHIVVCHDDTVDRTTNGTGRIADLTLAEIKQLDTGYRFTEDGETFPFRGRGITMPTFEEVLEMFPDKPINVELKVDDDQLVALFIELIGRYGRLNDGSIMVVGTSHKLVKKIRRLVPAQLTGYSKLEITLFVFMTRLHLAWLMPRRAAAFQVPVRQKNIEVVTANFVKFAHRIGAEVHAWTINDPVEIERLLDLGVDGIFTDRPGLMCSILRRRGQR